GEEGRGDEGASGMRVRAFTSEPLYSRANRRTKTLRELPSEELATQATTQDSTAQATLPSCDWSPSLAALCSLCEGPSGAPCGSKRWIWRSGLSRNWSQSSSRSPWSSNAIDTGAKTLGAETAGISGVIPLPAASK